MRDSRDRCPATSRVPPGRDAGPTFSATRRPRSPTDTERRLPPPSATSSTPPDLTSALARAQGAGDKWRSISPRLASALEECLRLVTALAGESSEEWVTGQVLPGYGAS